MWDDVDVFKILVETFNLDIHEECEIICWFGMTFEEIVEKDVKILQYMISEGADLKQINEQGNTILLCSCYNMSNHAGVKNAKWLLENYAGEGLLINHRNNENFTALFYATQLGQSIWHGKSVIELLLKHGADVNIDIQDKYNFYGTQSNLLIINVCK